MLINNICRVRVRVATYVVGFLGYATLGLGLGYNPYNPYITRVRVRVRDRGMTLLQTQHIC